MEATIVQDKTKHYPVLLKEIISIITPQYGGTFIDCTFGQGGYTREILKNKDNKVIGFDRDSECIKIAKEIEKEFPNRFIFKNLSFSKLRYLKLKNENIRGVLFDLGYSFTQIKDSKKEYLTNKEKYINRFIKDKKSLVYEMESIFKQNCDGKTSWIKKINSFESSKQKFIDIGPIDHDENEENNIDTGFM